MTINEETLNRHRQPAVTDFGSPLHAPLAVIGEERIRKIATGGFTYFRRATETPFNFVLEAKKRRGC